LKLNFKNIGFALLAVVLILMSSNFEPVKAAAPNFATAVNLTNGGVQGFPVVSGNILAYSEGTAIGQIVVKNLATDESVDIPVPVGSDGCFAPAISADGIVFSCSDTESDFRIYYVDISTLDWDNPAQPTDLIPEITTFSTMAPKTWSHYVAYDLSNEGSIQIMLYDFDEPYSEGVNPVAIGIAEPMPVFGLAIDEFQDGVIAWYGEDSTIKIYNLNDASPEIESFAVDGTPGKISVNQTYIVWSTFLGETSTIYYKTLADLAAEPTEIPQQAYGFLGPAIYDDSFVYLSFSDVNFNDGKLYYFDLATAQSYLAQENISLNGISQSMSILFYILFPPLALNETNIFWSDAPTEVLGDIYSLDYVHGSASTVHNHSSLSFAKLPGTDTTINITDGQTITSNPFTIQVHPTDKNGIDKVEFFVDNNLICTATEPNTDGVYSCDWDTSEYHSDVKVIAYNKAGKTESISRSATVQLTSTATATNITNKLTELPETGADLN